MRKSKFSPTQIAKILQEFDMGKSVLEISRDHGVSSAVFYKWRSKYAEINSNGTSSIRIKNNNFEEIRKINSSIVRL